ncbi:hypothetical protein ACFQXA_25690 [Nocardiopsis composta]
MTRAGGPELGADVPEAVLRMRDRYRRRADRGLMLFRLSGAVLIVLGGVMPVLTVADYPFKTAVVSVAGVAISSPPACTPSSAGTASGSCCAMPSSASKRPIWNGPCRSRRCTGSPRRNGARCWRGPTGNCSTSTGRSGTASPRSSSRSCTSPAEGRSGPARNPDGPAREHAGAIAVPPVTPPRGRAPGRNVTAVPGGETAPARLAHR